MVRLNQDFAGNGAGGEAPTEEVRVEWRVEKSE